MGMKLEYDSEHPEKTSPMLAGQVQAYEETIKKPVTISYDALGHLVGDSTDAFQGQLKDVIIELPKEELTVGSKWTSDKSQSGVSKQHGSTEGLPSHPEFPHARWGKNHRWTDSSICPT